MSQPAGLFKKQITVKKKLSVFTRVTVLLAGISLFLVLYVPVWRIELNAPQYPEGLCLKIHANDIKGDVEIINGLNHYIGMKTLHKADFPEFTILPYCIVFFALLFIVISVINRRAVFHAGFVLFVLFGVIAMADFWKWEYNYGHNLNPNAAIVVPGMAYQPPLIGFKQLLNFGAYSIPDTGGWIFVGCGALLLADVVVEWRRSVHIAKHAPLAMAAILLMFLNSCSKSPEPLKVGRDNCAFCKMTISDPRFGGELVTATGKTYKFDDIQCLLSYRKQMGTVDAEEVLVYLTDYSGTHKLVAADKSYLLNGSSVQCPMQGHLIAFSNPDSLKNVSILYKGEQTNWVQAK